MDQDLQRQLIEDFVLQSVEELESFDRELLALETRDGSAETLRTIFRVIHTIKGTAGCIGLGRVERLSHSAENVLSLVQKGKLEPTSDIISTMLKVSDRLGSLVRTVEQTGTDDGADVSDLLSILEQIQSGGAAAAAVPQANTAFGLFDDDDDAATAGDALVPAITSSASGGSAAPVVVASASDAAKPSLADGVIRVDVTQLDALMNLVGELVLTRNQIIATTGGTEHAGLSVAAQRLNVLTSELQERVMKTRMQPIGNVWAKFPRTVRDLASDLGKKVRLVMDGQGTELDRTIIEAIRDPLTHLVRNAIDHGLETPSDRRAAGKPEEGLLAIRAFHEGGQVNIEIMDDGHGIEVERVKAKAVQNGLIDADRAARMTEREALGLIFLPGFSTAEKVTNVSGRGVGMDVVRSNVEKTGGSIDVHSEVGQGTTIRLKIPLTLAIIPALIVTAADERYAIPQMSLVELVRLERGKGNSALEMLYGRPVYRLRGRLLPLMSLSAELKLGDPAAVLGDSDITNIVVLSADGHEFGLIVDAVNDTEEIVVKPLGKQLKGATVYAGATIMGDGRVALILDALGMAQRAGVVTETKDRYEISARDAVQAVDSAELPQELLLFSVGNGHRMAVPLGMTTRLEEIPKSRVERAGTSEVVQYRGRLLPLIRVAEFLGEFEAESDSESLHIIVASLDGVDAGLVVGRIDDIVQDHLTARRDATGPGILGSAVVNGRVTDLLDVVAILQSVAPARVEPARIASAA